MDATSTATMFGTYVSDIGGLLSDNLGAVLVIAAALFGLVLLVKYAKRFIAGR